MTRYGYSGSHRPDDGDVIVQHGRMTLRFPAGTTQATIDKRRKAIDKASKESPTPKRPSLPKLTRCRVPSKDMMEAAGRIGWDYSTGKNQHDLQNPDKPAVVMPEHMLRAGLLAQAERTLKKWPAENPPEHAAFMEKIESGKLANVPTEYIEKVVASILRPGGRVVSGKFAASLVYGLAELDRRRKEQAA